MKLDDIKRVAVIGAGAMGHGISQVLAMNGFPVNLNDVDAGMLNKAMNSISDSLDNMIVRGKMGKSDKAAVLDRISIVSDMGEAISGSQVVIEAVPESMDLKKYVFDSLSDLVSKSMILTTNTSTMRISEIGRVVAYPERFAGTHFFYPASKMKLVEVIFGEYTEESTINLLCDLVAACGKIPIRVLKDAPGFIVNRINAPNQALASAILDEGTVAPEAIDNMMRSVGMPMGPFELADFVGLDIFCHTLDYYSRTLSPDYRPGKVLRQKVAEKKLGMKTNVGIYEWKAGKAVIDANLGTEDITALDFLSVQVNEAIRVHKEAVAESAAHIDEAVMRGMNAIAGPFALGRESDHHQMSEALDRLKKRFKLPIFRAEPELRDGSFKDFLKG